MIWCHNGGILMKSLGQVFGFSSLLLFGCFSSAVAQPTNNWLQPTKTSSARSANIEKINRIHLPQVRFENLSLTEVVRQLNELAKQFDPDKTGVVISVSTNSADASTEEESPVAINTNSLK